HQSLAVDLDVPVEPPQHRVVLQQVGQGPGVGDVVHRDEVELHSSLPRRSEEVPTDPAEAIDADLDRHVVLLRIAVWHAGTPDGANPSTRARRPSSNGGAWVSRGRGRGGRPPPTGPSCGSSWPALRRPRPTGGGLLCTRWRS